MTLAVVNSFPLKIDEDSLLKRKVMAVIQELSVFQMEAFTILFLRSEQSLLESHNRSSIFLVFIHDSFLWIQTTSPPHYFCFWCVCFFVCLFFYFFYVSNSNLLTQSQRALSCLMLVRYSIKSLCYNPSSVLITFYHIINLIWFFFRFCTQLLITEC